MSNRLELKIIELLKLRLKNNGWRNKSEDLGLLVFLINHNTKWLNSCT